MAVKKYQIITLPPDNCPVCGKGLGHIRSGGAHTWNCNFCCYSINIDDTTAKIEESIGFVTLEFEKLYKMHTNDVQDVLHDRSILIDEAQRLIAHEQVQSYLNSLKAGDKQIFEIYAQFADWVEETGGFPKNAEWIRKEVTTHEIMIGIRPDPNKKEE